MMMILITILFDETFKYGDGAKFLGCAVTNAEPFCLGFCNLVQCRMFVNYLTCG
jgi:citrate lyase synthetase